jgi:hypothetical protein
MKRIFKTLLQKRQYLVILYILLSLLAGIQMLVLPPTIEVEGQIEYTRYNNYKIFTSSHHHLVDGKDLYINYPEEHWDLFKYTPTFSVVFGLFAYLPDWIGLNLWLLLNALVLLAGIYYIPRLSMYEKGLLLLLLTPELMTSLQNAQSNALIAGLLILAYGFLERGKSFPAAYCILFSAFIKLFGIVGIALFVLYPHKLRSSIHILLSFLILMLFPFLFIDAVTYLDLMKRFLGMLSSDHSASYGLSVMGWLHTWFGIDGHKEIIVLSGIVIFLMPFLRFSQYSNFRFRMLALCSVLLWIVIFNHKAESPTFIIAMTGSVIWFSISGKNAWNYFLLVLAIIFTSLSSTDLFPAVVREHFFKPYVFKAIPCILIWFNVIKEMLLIKSKENDGIQSKNQIPLQEKYNN